MAQTLAERILSHVSGRQVRSGDVVAEHEAPDATGTVTITHAYSDEGRFTASLVVTDDDGAKSVPMTTPVLIDQTPPGDWVVRVDSAYDDQVDAEFGLSLGTAFESADNWIRA